LTNAIRYAPGRRRIKVAMQATELEVQVSVSDAGVGISPVELQHIFSKFYRVEETNPTISGLGIGLYLSNEIITRHHGRLWAESELGHGSTFYFSLPLLVK